MEGHVVAVGALDVEGLGLTARGVPEELLAGELHLDAAAADLLADPGVERLVVDVLLGAEAAADVGLDHADVAPGDAERLADDAANDVGNLRGAHADDLVALHVAVAHAGLDVDLGLLAALGVDGDVVVGGVVQGLVHGLVPRLGELVVGRDGAAVGGDVVGLALLDGHLGALHGLERVVDHGVLLVLHVDLAQSAVAGDGVLANDDGDVVAVDAHAVVEQLAVCLVALRCRGVRIPRVAGDGVGDVRHVEAREHGDDAGDLERLGGVDRDDAAVGDGRMEKLGLQARLRAQIVSELSSARHLIGGIDAHDRTTDFLELLHDSLPIKRSCRQTDFKTITRKN